MKTKFEKILGRKVQNTRVIPIVLKIVLIFTVLFLLSNFVTNYINLTMNKGKRIQMMQQLLVLRLKDITSTASDQYRISRFSNDEVTAIKNVEERALLSFDNDAAVILGVNPDDSAIMIYSSKGVERRDTFQDGKALERMNASAEEMLERQGSIFFRYAGSAYFGVYAYNPDWGVYLIQAEELREFYSDSNRIFFNISLIIIAITLICAAFGIYCISYILRFVRSITADIMVMQENLQLNLIDLSDAPNDEITYLGTAFNALSSTIGNLLNIFQKFVSQDVADKAYMEKEIRLEGSSQELAILFSDIRGFTFITETLGTDIIHLLNIHYQRAIAEIIKNEGIVGSIIGDALLAVYGIEGYRDTNKSLNAVRTAHGIQQVASLLRQEMTERKERLQREKGGMSEMDKKIYKAVMLEVGVGIDGGSVFYGNIGSYDRMTNTVIGDNVNASSRLEGLTRLYGIPIICSEFVMNDIVGSGNNDYHFMEIDKVQVKGKTVGQKIYWPIEQKMINDKISQDIEVFESGLKLYYDGDWQTASEHFKSCEFPVAEFFDSRVSAQACPKDWDGIWKMEQK